MSRSAAPLLLTAALAALLALGCDEEDAGGGAAPNLHIPGEGDLGEAPTEAEAQAAALGNMPGEFEPALAIPGEENVEPQLTEWPADLFGGDGGGWDDVDPGAADGSGPRGSLPPGGAPGPGALRPNPTPGVMQPTVAVRPSGALVVAPGLRPDPVLVAGHAGGPQDASRLFGGCRGWIGSAPNHVMDVRAPMQRLQIVVRSPVDTTLVVVAPDGTPRCDDDTAGDYNPMIAGAFSTGPHRVFVGTYAPGGAAPYHLAASERGLAWHEVPPPG